MSNEWKLVPVEPTQAMMDAGDEALDAVHTPLTTDVWQSMLDAAPDAPSAEPVAHACWGRQGHVEIQGSDALTSLLGRKAIDPVRVALYALPPDAAAEVERLRARVAGLERWKNSEPDQADETRNMFHAAILDLAAISEALGCDPDDGGAVPIIEAINELKSEIADMHSKGHRLALELECLIMDVKDTAVTAKWWDSALSAIEEWRK